MVSEGHKSGQSKALMRKRLLETLSSLDRNIFLAEGQRAAEFLVQEKIFSEINTVLLFLSMPGEIDTGPVLQHALDSGKKVFAPSVK